MSRGLAAFVAGMGSGYLNAEQLKRDQARQDKLDARGDELHTARMDEINQANKLRMGLADAVAPRTAQAGTVLDGGQTKEFYQDPVQVTPQLQQDRQIEAEMRAEQGGQTAPAVQTSQGYGTTGMGLGNQITAHRPDVEALNSPQEQAKRIGLAYGLNGEPIKALQFQKATEDMEQAKKDRFAKLQSEGATLAARAMLSGNPNEVFHTYNAQGKSKLKEPPKVTAEDIEMPGIGKIKNYVYSGTLIDENGQEKPFTMGSHQANMALLPYKDMMKMQMEGLSSMEDAKNKGRMAAAAEKTAEATMLRAKNNGIKPPAGYRATASGNLEAIPGGPADLSAPGNSGKPLPISAAKGLLENQTNLRRAQTALALANGKTVDGATGDSDATGWKGLVPNQVLNRVDPEGVDTRAAIADLGSLVIHDRSGAAVTAAEFPRLAPFIPAATDDAETVKKKLGQFTKNYQAIVDDASEFYRASGYNVPTEVLKSGNGAEGSWDSADAGQPKNTAQTKSVSVGGVAMKARLAPDGKYYVTLANGKHAEVRN